MKTTFSGLCSLVEWYILLWIRRSEFILWAGAFFIVSGKIKNVIALNTLNTQGMRLPWQPAFCRSSAGCTVAAYTKVVPSLQQSPGEWANHGGGHPCTNNLGKVTMIKRTELKVILEKYDWDDHQDRKPFRFFRFLQSNYYPSCSVPILPSWRSRTRLASAPVSSTSSSPTTSAPSPRRPASLWPAGKC